MNPYLLTGLAMCGVVIVAAIGTSYLAVYFTRRAKSDLTAAMTPLAEMLDGQIDVENAEVKGTWRGTHVLARMGSAAAGTVRVWQTDIIDAAGGAGWNYVYSRPNKRRATAEIDIVTDRADIRQMLEQVTVSSLEPLQPDATDWVQVEYNPDGGYIRGARPMHGRNDIPSADVLEREIRYLIHIGNENRAWQEAHR